ncbi:MAG: hypothetical protein V1936_01605 [Patescibacteria group bacterium]
MENRLVFFAAAAEAQSENPEAAKVDPSADELKSAAEQLAKTEGAKAKPGGHQAVSQARSLMDNPQLSDFAKQLLQKKIGSVEAAVSARQNKLTPEATATLNKAVADLQKSVNFQKSRLAGNATANAEFGRLASLENANELFKDVKISVNGKEFKWKKGGTGDFRLLSLEGKQALLKKMNEQVLANPGATAAALEKFAHDPRLPKKWQEYAKEPAKWGHAKDHAAKWLLENSDKKILQAETAMKFLEGKAPLLAKAGERMPSRDEIFDKSTSEFNTYFDQLKAKIGKLDAAQAAQFDQMKIADAGKIQTAKAENTEAVKKIEAKDKNQAEKLAPQLQQFAINQKLAQKAAARQRELEAAGKKEVGTVEAAMSLRQRAQAGESVGLGQKMKNLLGFGKKSAADNYPGQAKKDGLPKEKRDFAAEARAGVAKDTLGDQKAAEEFYKGLGIRPPAAKEDSAKLASLLSLEKFDAENVRAKLTPELKALLARQAADGYEVKKAA